MIRDIKKLIKKEVDSISELAFEIIPDKKVFPHVIASFTGDIVNEGLHSITIDFDIWDKGDSTRKVDDIEEQLINKLDRIKIFDKGLSLAIYHLSSGYVSDREKHLIRKTCIFELQARKVGK